MIIQAKGLQFRFLDRLVLIDCLFDIVDVVIFEDLSETVFDLVLTVHHENKNNSIIMSGLRSGLE